MTDATRCSLLRLEVGRLRAEQPRQRFDAVIHVGRLGGPHRSCPVPAGEPLLDAGTRTDVVLRLLESGAGEAAVEGWLTRPGEPLLQDDDLGWLSATLRAYGVVGRTLEGFWSVTRTGWLDVRTGERRTWRRLRI